jgi:phenylalanyl-tRNA synthetase beta chain
LNSWFHLNLNFNSLILPLEIYRAVEMKISIDWLKKYITIEDSTEELAHKLTNTGLEVEGIEKFEEIEGGLEGLVIGKVVSCEKHPNADKLKITTVDTGDDEIIPVICGAPNVAEGQKVVVAKVGKTLFPTGGGNFEIKKTKIRGEVSEGMICAEDEIGLGTRHDGILVLDTDLPLGSPVKEYFEVKSYDILEIGLTPNRADATSHIGVARDIKAFSGNEVTLPDVSDFKTDNQNLPIEVIVEKKEACPRYSGVTIKDVTIKESPKWLQKRLLSIGLAPINNVVDVTNFVLHEFGQPLHAFDADKIKGGKVVVKTLPEGTKFVTLDEEERSLKADDLMICDETDGMCIAGVFGGIGSGVTDSTTNIFLESAYFSPDYIRKTALVHDLKTDASFRFERGTDPNITVHALKRAAMLIKEVAGGTISSDIIDVYPVKITDFEVKMKYININRLIGKVLDKETIFNILKSLDIKVDGKNESGFTAWIPPYRVDVQREADVIEEILRIYGYDNVEIPDQLNSDYLADFPEKDIYKIQEKLSDLLASNGFNEIMTNSLSNPVFSEKIEGFNPQKDVEILNKLSPELGVLRQSVLFTGLEVLAYNINHRQKDLKLFEFGKGYIKHPEGYDEYNELVVYLTGNIESESWIQESREVEFHDIYDIVQKVFSKFNILDTEMDFGSDPVITEGIVFKHNNKVLAHLGYLDKAITKLADIKQKVIVAKIDWDLFLELSNMDITFEPVSKFPEVRRDLSLVIDKNVTFKNILQIVNKNESKLVRNVNVFDYYVGEKLASDKKAYAMSFILQDKGKTLTDKMIDKTMQRLMLAFENELGAVIRK